MADENRENAARDAEDGDDGLDDLVESLKDRRRTGSTDVDVGGSTPDDPPNPVMDLLDDAEPDDPATAYDATALDDVGDAESVLVLGPLKGELCDEPCTELLTRSDDHVENVLYITATHDVDDRLHTLATYSERAPRHVGVVRISGNDAPGGQTAITTTTESGPDEISVFRVNDPSDLTRLGITVTRFLNDTSVERGRTGICLHSLSALLQYVDRQRLFRFLHVLQSKVDDLEIGLHCHMNPVVHDEQTVGVFRTLFDTVVEIDEDGTTTVVR